MSRAGRAPRALCRRARSALRLVNQLTTLFVAPARLSRLDYSSSGVPASRRTIVVVPLLLDSPAAAQDALEHLETQFLANRDAEIRFALLADFRRRGVANTLPTDAAIVDAATTGVRALNNEYAGRIAVLSLSSSTAEKRRRGRVDGMGAKAWEARGVQCVSSRAGTECVLARSRATRRGSRAYGT